jgi:hypothetical protein
MKVSELSKRKNELLKGFAEAGQGLLQMLTGFMAVVVVTVKGLPYYFMGSASQAAAAREMIDTQIEAISKGAQQFLTGSEKSLSAIWHTVGPMLEPMIAAWKFSAPGSSRSEREAAITANPAEQREAQVKALAQHGAVSPEDIAAMYINAPDLPSTPDGPAVAPVAIPAPTPSSPATGPLSALHKAETGAMMPQPVPSYTQYMQANVGATPIIVGDVVIRARWTADPDATRVTAALSVTRSV